MSDEVIIRAEGLGKKYRIKHQAERQRYTALRDVIADSIRSPLRRLWNGRRPKIEDRRSENGGGGQLPSPNFHLPRTEEFWALRHINFEVRRGEVLGIIGRNGAGKTTLLKILSRITDPTEGRVRIRGRVASLLEVGTGFHPELTGRENIFLNGAILGMSRAEIKSRFDEIVAFAEIEKFLDTPVKRYSSGMYVRLAFAVAAHLDPEILIIDEVLAVGDAEFQKKCLGKMEQVAKGGRTVLFVSHNMATVNRLCQKGILLESGRVKVAGNVHSVTGQYMIADTGTMAARDWTRPAERPGDDVARLLAVCVRQNDRISDVVDIRYSVDLEMTYENLRDGANIVAAFSFFDPQGVHLFVSGDINDSKWSQPRPAGIYISKCRVPGNIFAEGIVRVAAEVSTRRPIYQTHFLVFDSVGFQVVDPGDPGSVRGRWGRQIPGVMRPMCDWRTDGVASAASTHERIPV